MGYMDEISKPLDQYLEEQSNSETEEGKEPTPEPKEESKEETKGGDAPQEETPAGEEFDFKKWSEPLGVEVDSLDTVKQRLTTYEDRVKEAEEAKARYEEVTKELEGYRAFADESADPMSYFASEEDFFVNECRKKYPNIDLSVATTLVTKDAKELDTLDALIMGEVIKHSDIGLREGDAELRILNRMGLESRDDLAEMDPRKKRLMEVDAKEARLHLARAQEEVRKAPEKRTPSDFIKEHQTKRQEVEENARKAYEPIVDDLIRQVEGEVKDGEETLFTIKLSEDYRKQLRDYALENVSRSRMGADEDTQRQVVSNLRAKAWEDNAARWIKAVRSEVETQLTERFNQERDNHKPLETERAKPTQTPQEGYSHLLGDMPKRRGYN